jgi:DNA-binding transcriptional LysR family regulator
MDMHHVRYFLAVARTRHFTRAAEECHVTQPSLTRAIKQLEDELGGDLFRRERPQAQLTELGHRMLPLLKQCYESAMAARSMASAMKSGDVASLRLALSHTIDLKLLLPYLSELQRTFSRLELKLMRGTGPEVVDCLKRGDAELGIAATVGETWERLDSWSLFTEGFLVTAADAHKLAGRPAVDLDDLRQERFIVRTYCEHAGELKEHLRSRDIDIAHEHEVTSERDLLEMLNANLGVALVPRSGSGPQGLLGVPVNGLDLRRTVYVYGVAGRERTAVASALLKMLRAAKWSSCEA